MFDSWEEVKIMSDSHGQELLYRAYHSRKIRRDKKGKTGRRLSSLLFSLFVRP